MRSSVNHLNDYGQFESVSVDLSMHQMPANSPPIAETMQINSMLTIMILIIITIASIMARMILSQRYDDCMQNVSTFKCSNIAGKMGWTELDSVSAKASRSGKNATFNFHHYRIIAH